MSFNDISAAVITWEQALFQLSLCLTKEAGNRAERKLAPSQLPRSLLLSKIEISHILLQ